jgi:hypothetical protein
MAELELQEQYDLLVVKYTNLLRLAMEGLQSCAACKGSGYVKFGLVTDKERETLNCNICERPALRKFIKGGG